MPIITTAKTLQLYYEFQSVFAVIFGMFVQFIFGDKRTWRIGILIFVSAIFVSLYIVPLMLTLMTAFTSMYMSSDGVVAITMYALSSLLSMEILAIIISVLPKGISSRLKKYLGVRDDKLSK